MDGMVGCLHHDHDKEVCANRTKRAQGLVAGGGGWLCS